MYTGGTSFQIGRIDMVANTGTYMDCPFHRYDHGRDLSEIYLHEIADLPGIRINALDKKNIGTEYFEGKDVAGKAVLVYTGWSRHWNTEQYFEGHPYLTAGAAEWLREKGAQLVGIDSHNIDDINDGMRPVHSTLLGAGILIVEHMTNLEALPDEGFYFTSVPPKVSGMGTFPVRAFAVVR